MSTITEEKIEVAVDQEVIEIIGAREHNLKNIDITIPRNKLIVITGISGSGKSSLVVDAVTWALWGRSRSSGAGDDLIHYGESACKVSVTLVIDEAEYVVTRTRTRDKKTTLSVESNSGNESGVVIKDTQERINRITGATYEVFKNSCFIEQGQFNSFSNLCFCHFVWFGSFSSKS